MNPQQFNPLWVNPIGNFSNNTGMVMSSGYNSSKFPWLTKAQEDEIMKKANQANVTESQKNYIINDMYQSQLKKNQIDKYNEDREVGKRELIQKSITTPDLKLWKQSKQAAKKWDVADMIRKYVSATQDIDITVLNKVPDDQIIADFTADNPEVAFTIDDFTKSDVSSQYFSEMMWFAQFDQQQEDQWFFKNILNNLKFGVEEWSAWLKWLIDKGLDKLEWNSNESSISMENATAFDNYIQHKYWVSWSQLAQSDRQVFQQERAMVKENPEVLKQYMTTTSQDVLNFAEWYTDTLFTATNPVMKWAFTVVGAAEQEMWGGVLTWLMDKMGWVWTIINEMPWLRDFRETLSPEDQQRFDMYVGNVAVWMILWTKNKKNIYKDPKTFLMENLQPNQITKNFVQNVTWMPDKFFGGVENVKNSVKWVTDNAWNIINKASDSVDSLSERWAKKITKTASSQDKLYKAQEPRMNVLSEKKNMEMKRANSDRANELILDNWYKPTNTSERLDAHQKTLNKLWGQVMEKVNQWEWVTVDQSTMIEALDNYIKDKKKLWVAWIESDIKALEAELKSLKKMQAEWTTDLPILENKKQVYNDLIDWKWQEASEVYKWGIKLLTQEIWKIEDAMISEIPWEFSSLKRDVWALLDTYEDVFKADMKNQRKKWLWLTETYSRLEWISDTLWWIFQLFKWDVSWVAKWLSKIALGKALAKATDVDFLIKQGFEDLYNERLGGNKSQASSKTAKYQTVWDRDLTLNNTKKEWAYDPRATLPKVKWWWTKAKIEKQIKEPITAKQKWVIAALEAIQEFDSPEDFKAHTFYHWTQWSFVGKPSMSIPEKTFDRIADNFWGGYGQRYWAISLTTDKKIASNFWGASDHVNINPVILRKNAKVIEMPKLSDSIELENHIEKLWDDGVDAVWIWDKASWEKELAVLNPKAIVDLEAPDYYRQYHLWMEDNPLRIKSDADFNKIYENASTYREELRNLSKEFAGAREKWEKENYGNTSTDELLNGDIDRYREMKRAWEESPEKSKYDEDKKKYNSKLWDVKDEIKFQKYWMADANAKTISAGEWLNIENFKNWRTVQEIADHYWVNTKIVDKILTPEWEKALGMYDQWLITLAKDLKESTVPHELLHATFDLVDATRRIEILDWIKKRLKVDDIQAEEWLADNFSDYYRTWSFDVKWIPTTLVWKIRQFFKDIKEFVDWTYKNRKQIQQLFDDILEQKDLWWQRGGKQSFEIAGDVYWDNFKRWFGDWENDKTNASKVVDENWEPLEVYHWTPENFTEFRKDMIWTNYGQDSQWFFFTDNKATAEDYANTTSYWIPRGEKWNVMSVYLDIKNPLIEGVDYDPINLWDNNYEKLLKKANDNGNDWIIIKADKWENLYIPFEPEQIKSATDNVGTYDPNKSDIRYQTMPDYDLRKWKSKWLKEIWEGKYGKIYTWLKGNQAVAFLLWMQDWEIKWALNVSGNPIDLTRSWPKIWVKKLFNKHPEALRRVQEMIDERLNSKKNHPQEWVKYVLEDDEWKVVFNVDWDWKWDKMFITAYKFKP